jgi:hypothetical protein
MTTPLDLTRARTNKFLAKAIDGLPEYHTALAVAERAQRMLAALAAVPDLPEQDHPLVSGRITEEWLSAVIDHEADVARLEKRRGLLLALSRDAQATAQNTYTLNGNKMLRQFHAELIGLLDGVREVAAELGAATTPEAAIADDCGPAWKQLKALAGDYDLLRAAQWTVMRSVGVDYVQSAQPIAGGESHASDLYLRNVDEVFPSWRNPGASGEVRINIDGSRPRYEPWPLDKTELLLWLVNSPAQAWIPTTDQLERLWDDRKARANPTPTLIRQPPKPMNRVVPTITARS